MTPWMDPDWVPFDAGEAVVRGGCLSRPDPGATPRPEAARPGSGATGPGSPSADPRASGSAAVWEQELARLARTAALSNVVRPGHEASGNGAPAVSDPGPYDPPRRRP